MRAFPEEERVASCVVSSPDFLYTYIYVPSKYRYTKIQQRHRHRRNHMIGISLDSLLERPWENYDIRTATETLRRDSCRNISIKNAPVCKAEGLACMREVYIGTASPPSMMQHRDFSRRHIDFCRNQYGALRSHDVASLMGERLYLYILLAYMQGLLPCIQVHFLYLYSYTSHVSVSQSRFGCRNFLKAFPEENPVICLSYGCVCVCVFAVFLYTYIWRAHKYMYTKSLAKTQRKMQRVPLLERLSYYYK